ncbi:MAG TPA: PRC-barrel domain-containing protein [Chloroflexota bacterium]|jgi:hypothetical protein
MREQYIGRIAPDMDVCDISGEKIGTVTHVYRDDLAVVGGAHGDRRPSHDEVVEVKTGFLGLGKRLYVPMSAFQEVIHGCAFLSRSRADIEQMEWEEKPSHLDELS